MREISFQGCFYLLDPGLTSENGHRPGPLGMILQKGLLLFDDLLEAAFRQGQHLA
jgi:hypothetical protein